MKFNAKDIESSPVPILWEIAQKDENRYLKVLEERYNTLYVSCCVVSQTHIYDPYWKFFCCRVNTREPREARPILTNEKEKIKKRKKISLG